MHVWTIGSWTCSNVCESATPSITIIHCLYHLLCKSTRKHNSCQSAASWLISRWLFICSFHIWFSLSLCGDACGELFHTSLDRLSAHTEVSMLSSSMDCLLFWYSAAESKLGCCSFNAVIGELNSLDELNSAGTCELRLLSTTAVVPGSSLISLEFSWCSVSFSESAL